MAHLCLGCIPGTSSISDMSPVQLFCSGKSTHTSVPFLLMERTTPTLWWVTEPHLYLTEQIHNVKGVYALAKKCRLAFHFYCQMYMTLYIVILLAACVILRARIAIVTDNLDFKPVLCTFINNNITLYKASMQRYVGGVTYFGVVTALLTLILSPGLKAIGLSMSPNSSQ